MIKDAHKGVTPTPALIRYWWGRLNTEIFGGKLPPPIQCSVHTSQESKEACGFDTWAWYEHGVSRGFGSFSFWGVPVTRQDFLTTLAHEMIHQYQHAMGKPTVHGRYFKVLCKKYGRKLGAQIT